MSKTEIEWTDHTWNPITGCTKISTGCLNCYAEKMHVRQHAMRPDVYPEKFSEITFHRERVTPAWIKKQGWKPGDKVFVGSMTDMFHPDVLLAWRLYIWDVMKDHPEITFQILTKRPDRMNAAMEFLPYLKNVWLGVTCENQQAADERIPILLSIPAKIRFISVEPMLGPLNLISIDCDRLNIDGFYQINALSGENKDMGRPCTPVNKLNWVICGAETGNGARYMRPEWAFNLYDQCKENGVAFFMKQFSKPKTFKQTFENLDRATELLKIRQFPDVKP